MLSWQHAATPDLQMWKRVCVVGLAGLRDLHPVRQGLPVQGDVPQSVRLARRFGQVAAASKRFMLLCCWLQTMA